ncbi:glycosyl transferase family 2 [Sulfuricella denitrificans skB26]|uniref:Glycosyl transferase family 2 n=1 Tax=Sulfuricella denitrificans (strain DSM 22764 / NBRC 105220 / skB26) TaxID=1163617 RepID=S6ABI0_SULDS|nr:glycosyltransferase [Sulfuricella denitrificans]BAN36775.1 glycosyl transferase family 2 [Sulfuricella denitrificans skB26]
MPLSDQGWLTAMDVSIIVCTYNRAESLRDTLSALHAQKTSPSRELEVVVVDNNSKDQTRAVVEEMQRVWPQLRYEFQGEQGLSHARNHGIAVAHGNTLLFTDDDVLPEPDWVEVTLAGLEKYRADSCGGYIAPIWEVPPPSWLTERFYGFLAIRTDRSDDYVITSPSQAPFGANMAFRREVFQKVGGFDTSRGRKGKVLASGEDGELFERILSAGLKAVFLGQSRVHHKVESFRLTKRYFRRWRFQSSRNIAQNKKMVGERRLLNIPLYVFPQFLRAVARMLWGHVSQPRDEAFNREMVVCHFLGLMQGLYRSRLS